MNWFNLKRKYFVDNHSESKNPVGLHLSIPETAYELAWLVFNSEQPDSELIAIVYDGSFTFLDGQIIFNGQDIVTWDQYQFKQQQLHQRTEQIINQWRLPFKNQNQNNFNWFHIFLFFSKIID